MTAVDAPPEARPGIGRAAAAITAWNLVSRLTGFARVVAMGAALGATALGDTYQAANLVSNVLFELLAGGMLSAVLVPTFVQRIEAGDRAGAARLASRLLALALAILAVVMIVGMVSAPPLMRALTVGVDDGTRADRIALGGFLLLFFLPQVLLYAVGAVASALLQAHHRFIAAAVAPVFNNVVVIATMIAFRAVRHGSTALDPGRGPALLLAIGTSAGVVAMTAVPLLALRRAGDRVRPTWPAPAERSELKSIARKGAWAAGHLGANQLLVATTIVLAARVAGGVVAYQIAFTFFLLPHAVLANPIFTALFPRLAADASAGRLETFGNDLGRGLRAIAFLLLPAAALLAALALPALQVVRVGALDADGARLVAAVLAAYAAGLVGYSGFFLLTRAAYALDDVRSPTVVNAAASVAGIAAMVAVSASVDGDARVVGLGLVHAAVVTVASAVLLARLRGRLGLALGLGWPLLRSSLCAVAGGGAAWAVSSALGAPDRGRAALALVAGSVAGIAVYVGAQLALRAPEPAELRGSSA